VVVSGQSRLAPGIKVQAKSVDAAKVEAAGDQDGDTSG
jgi:hypothetical protein